MVLLWQKQYMFWQGTARMAFLAVMGAEYVLCVEGES